MFNYLMMISVRKYFTILLILVCALGMSSVEALAQDRPPRQIRTYVPPDQLVSFLPTTPFNQFVDFINPIFERVTGKQVVDPEGRTDPIGVTITSLQFFDALEFVLELKNLTYRETDRVFLIEEAQAVPLVLNADQATGNAGAAATQITVPATVGTREVQINAILFDANVSRALELGVDWSAWFSPTAGQTSTGGGGGFGGGAGDDQNQVPRLFVNTSDLFNSVDEFIIGPSRVSVSAIAQLFRVFETEGLGQTIANPSVTVQSGQEGNIQIGSDVPVQQRDFAGNTITQFFQTGIIIKVTPTVIKEALSDSVGAPIVEFIHLDVEVENSNSRPTTAGVEIDRNKADTQILLLDGEQTIIGGLYSTEESVSRRGIPLLKDLPPWFFGLRYIFGYNRTDTIRRELLIVLQARLLDPLTIRSQRPYFDQLLERRRRQVEQDLRRIDAEKTRDLKFNDK